MLWKSADKSVVSVTETGEITAQKAGSANVTATAKADTSKTAVCKVTVVNKGDGTYCYYVNTSREELSYEYGTCHIAELQNETYDDVSISKVNNKYKKYVEDMGL